MTTFNLSEDAQKWLAMGQRGISSETIFSHLSGLKINDRESTPADPDDLKRCRLLLKEVPEFVPLFPKMAEVSYQWKMLVERWDELCALFDSECPEWWHGRWNAPKTYRMMKDIGL